MKAPKEIEALYSYMAKRYYGSGMYISAFHLAKRLGDKGLESKALEKEASKFSLFGFDAGSKLFLSLANERMKNGSLEDIDIPQIELSIINAEAKRLVAHYSNAKELFGKASGKSALRHAKKLVSSMYAMSRLDSLYGNISQNWPFPFAEETKYGRYDGRDYFIAENLDYLDSVCPKIAKIAGDFDFVMGKKILKKIKPLSVLLEKLGVEESLVGRLVPMASKLIGSATDNSGRFLNVLSDLGKDRMSEAMQTIGGADGPVTKMNCLYLSIENLERIAEKGNARRAEDILESMQLMAMWNSCDMHSFERLLAISRPMKSYGRQTNLDRYLKLRRK
jgi:hypothetical protein